MAKACCGGCETNAGGATCDDAGLEAACVREREGYVAAKGKKTHLASEKGCHVGDYGDGNDISDENVPAL